jgi:hypothetical protein
MNQKIQEPIYDNLRFVVSFFGFYDFFCISFLVLVIYDLRFLSLVPRCGGAGFVI